MLCCPTCDLVALLSSPQCFKLFPYDDNRTPRCKSCNHIARRYCNICDQKFAYNKPIADYHQHLKKCLKDQQEQEVEEEKQRLHSTNAEILKKEAKEEELLDQLSALTIRSDEDAKKDLDPFHRKSFRLNKIPAKGDGKYVGSGKPKEDKAESK